MLLREFFPNGRFGDPVLPEEIERAEALLGVTLPSDLRELYRQCDGFREDRGNAKYLLSLFQEDTIGSLVSTTRSHWQSSEPPDLRAFLLFGFSGGDEVWGIRVESPHDLIAYHHHMEGQYENLEGGITDLFLRDYAAYGAV
jgi:hypothetical protein